MGNKKSILTTCTILGSAVGSYAPALFGGSALSFTSVITAALGGIAGIYIGLKITNLYS